MNKERRKQISAVIGRLSDCAGDFESIKDEEDESRENIPENLQSGDRYSESEECSGALEDAASGIQEIIDNIENII